MQPIAHTLLRAHTAAWPKPVQSYGRLFCPPAKPLSSRRTANLPRWKGLPELSSACRGCLAQGQDTGALVEGRFSFLHREISFPGEIEWSPPGTERLWRHHLQYLDWALALALNGSPGCLTVLNERLDEWLMRNPQGWSDGWEPYPLSARIVNLAYMLSLPGAISRRRAEMLHAALAVQARALTRGIDTALQGNHLIKNGKALLIAGLAFAGEEAEDWYRRGLALLERELEIQVHPDGGHADRSAMYQIQVFLDYLESLSFLKNTGRHIPPIWIKRLKSMAVCFEALYHPDGLPALLGDTSLAGLPPKRQVLAMARELGILPKRLNRCATLEFPDISYLMGRDLRRGNYLVVDSGAHGDAIEAAHHHCQAFSYELSLDGRRLVTDTGTGSYEAGPDRTYARSTAAHNTIYWRDREQAEFWDAFRMGRRTQILHRRVHETANGALHFEGRMKGFYPGLERGCWKRRLLWMPAGRLEVTDLWQSPRPAQGVVSNVHFAPGLILTNEQGGRWSIRINNGPRIATMHVLEGKGALRRSPYYPSFGEKLERECLEIALVADTARYQISSGT